MASVKMFENDATHAFQRTKPKRSKQASMIDPAKLKRDEFIMDTNNSSIVSKRSVEKLYWTGQPEYFRHFVSKLKRRSPLINRGYWLRMAAVEHSVQRFLEEPSGKRKVVVNLGCGYDPLPWLFVGKRPHLCDAATFVDVDYPQLMQTKRKVITQTEQLSDLLPNLIDTGKNDGIMLRSDNYAAIGCDLRNLDMLSLMFRDQLHVEECSVAILFVAEVSTAYMDREGSQAVLEWAAHYDDVRFCLLEQHLPDGADHPFAQTMLKHFEKLRTPLHAIGTIGQMKQRFTSAGWPEAGIDIRPLWELWSDSGFLSSDERKALDVVEPFDEWEEFALFASHYFLMVARKPATMKDRGMNGTPSDGNADLDIEERKTGEATSFQQFEGPQSHRRFAATVPPFQGNQIVALSAGLGTKERLTTTDVYTTTEVAQDIRGPSMRTGLMCHTVTKLANSDDCLLVGGRTSPDRASSDCWLRRNGEWEKTCSLPKGRYRHCAVPGHASSNNVATIIYGGKSGQSTVLGDFLVWTEESGWQNLTARSEDGILPAARFGAVMTVDGPNTGLMIGGMIDDGTILNDCWEWSWDGKSGISLRNITSKMRSSFGRDILGRFGAQIAYINRKDNSIETLLIGGVVGGQMLTRDNEILNLTRLCTHPLEGPRPLFVGHNVSDRLVLGGGATCFSFGTYWNASGALRFASDGSTELPVWHLQPQQSKPVYQTDANPSFALSSDEPNTTSAPKITSIPRYTLDEASTFDRILAAGKPAILSSCDLGPCLNLWETTYLASRIGSDRPVVVHASPTSSTMNFQTKNFTYQTMPFSEFLASASTGSHLYLRSLSQASPSEKPTSLAEDYPSIAPDFRLPSFFSSIVEDKAHSSPLRISGNVGMWLHYDVMANVLCQVRGTRRLRLFPPADVGKLAFAPGASSSSLDVFSSTQPLPANTHPHDALLQPGDVLFLPPLWLHAAAPSEDLSVAVNIFFRSLQAGGYAAGRDVYGNRDLAAYEKGRRDVSKIVKAFEDLPVDVSRFYLERLGMELVELARRG